jgi:hypothetical protein
MTKTPAAESDEDCPFDGVVSTGFHTRPKPVPPPERQSDLQRICSTPIESLSFKDFLSLKSGRDSFSRVKLPELRTGVSEPDRVCIASAFATDDKAQASCLRWILRGLDAEKAIRKVQADIEIADKAIAKRRG